MSPAAYSVPALMTLLAEIDEMSPDRDRSADGWIGDLKHQARHSDHNPEGDGSVDARDFTHDPAHGVDCNLLADQIKDDARLLGGGYVIWNRRIWNPDVSKTWRPYTGSNPHDHHMHVSVSDAGQNDTSPWLTDPEEITVAQYEDLLEAERDTRKLMLQLAIREERRDRRQLQATWRGRNEVLNAIAGRKATTDEEKAHDAAVDRSKSREAKLTRKLTELGGQPLDDEDED